ncbi:SEC-C metal-binding domain-containing protein [Galbibacter sp. EGI 63066]|uniref:SEC-C metal-binding domain-containing protein n=1 Tax=Galbibacter sp. EGI 63066 TaxID=2993559 RepID=UPI003A522886
MTKTLGRNDPCHCGSGKKYKRCCMGKERLTRTRKSKMALIVVVGVILLGIVLVVVSMINSGN